MPSIKMEMLFVGSIGERKLSARFDDGANLSRVNITHIEGLANMQMLGRTRHIATVFQERFIEVNHVVLLDFYLNDVLLSDEFLVVPGLGEEVIIGAATMRKWRIKLDFEQNKATVDPNAAKMQLI